MRIKLASIIALLGAFYCTSGTVSYADSETWTQKKAPLTTRWAKDVNQDNVHPEYPRPQMVRDKWMNLNGLWDYAIVSRDLETPQSYQGKILVPFAAESAISGVMQSVNDQQQIWYKRTFSIPEEWKNKNLILHFGASDWETTVFVNNKKVGTHKGGYTAFEMDITNAYLVPNSWVLDAVNLSVEEVFYMLSFDTSLDAGYAHCGTTDFDPERYGKSVRRKTDTDGYFVDTNNSASDFISDAVPSLAE